MFKVKRFCALVTTCSILASADQIQYSAYYINDNSDNTVATTSFSLAKTLWGRTMVLLDVELDQTTVPPLMDGVTGASRPSRQSKSEFKKNRGQIIAGVEQGLGDNTRLIGSVYFSQEVDYQSQAIIGGISQDFRQKNFTISLLGQYTMDSVGEILSSGEVINQFKESHKISLSMAQLLTPTATLKGGVDAMRMQGFLSDPYREISRPNLRYRQAGWAEVSKFLRGLDAAFIFKYRYYWDDWDLNSHTATLKLNKYITKDFIFSPMYRYYDQTGAKFGGYGDTEFYDPTDYKLLPFGSNTVGLGLTCYLRTFSRNHPTWDFLNNSSVNVQYFRYFNDLMPKHYSANLLATRILFTF